VDHVDLGHGGEAVPVGLELTQAGLRCFESFGGLVALRLEASVLFALGALALTALLGFLFPRIPAVLPFGQWPHHLASDQRDGPRPSQGIAVGITRSPSPRTIGGVMHISMPPEGRLSCHRTAQGDPMTSNRMEAKPMAGEPCRFCGDAKAP
jgi:hypothetical protein